MESDEPTIAAVDDLVVATWYEADPVSGRDIYFTRSTDGGRSFAPASRLDLGPGATVSTDPVIAAAGAIVAVFWLDDRADPLADQDIVGRVSQDGGATFGPELLVSGPLTGDIGDADNLGIAISGANIHLVFEDDIVARTIDSTNSNEDIYVVSSQDGGVSFAAPQAVNRPPLGLGSADVDDPTLVATGDRVYVAWVDRRNGVADKVFLNVSSDAGQTFDALDRRLDAGTNPADDTEDPRLAASGDEFVAIWRDARQATANRYQVYANGSVDGGLNLLGERRIDQASSAAGDTNALRGRVELDGTVAHAVWADDRFGVPTSTEDIFYARFDVTAAGVGQPQEQRIDVGTVAGSASAGLPRVAARDGYVHIYWQDRRDDPLGLDDSLYLRVSTDGGTTFGAELALAEGLGIDGDAEENEMVFAGFRDLVCIWGDNTSDPVGGTNDIRVNGLRLPSLAAETTASTLRFTLSDTALLDEGSVFLTVISASGTAYGQLPISTIGLGAALTIDPFTLVGLDLLPVLSGVVVGGGAQTAEVLRPPIPLFAVGLTWNPSTPFDFATATDPVLVLP